MKPMRTALTFLFATLWPVLTALSADWPQWRGPNFNGSSPETGLPSQWTRESAAWALAMPGPSASTPVILGGHVFTSTVDAENKTMHALAIERATGKVLWDRRTGDGISRDDRSNFSSPSPIASPERVIFFYGNGTLVAFDHAGQELWKRSITADYGDFAFQWTFASTPLLHNGKLYVQVLQRNAAVHGRGKEDAESYLLALDPATGKTLWRHVRPSEAVAESLEAFSTPIPFTHQGRTELLISGGDCLTGHNPETGAELWRWGTWNPNKIGHWRLVPSPVAGGGVVLACAPKGSPIYAIQAGGQGVLPESSITWTSAQNRDVTADVPTPLFYQNDFFILNDLKGILSRIDPRTGQPRWSTPLPGRKKFETSPTGADGKIYVMNFAGEVVVVDATEGKVLSAIPMGEPGEDMVRSTIAVAQGQIFIRTNKKLFCIGRNSAVASK